MPGAFEKVGECLYRYVPTGMYYARFEVGGKEVRRSLRTTDKALAKRRLPDLQRDLARVDLSAGSVCLADACDRYLATVQNQKPKTVRRKQDIAARLKADFPGGVRVPVAKVAPSRVAAWLASYDFGSASYNLYLEFIRAVFALAVEDRLLPSSPVESLKGKRPAKPIRQTPSMEEFRSIVAEIRAQRFNADAQASADFVEFIGLAGLGQAETASLRWSDVDWQKKRLVTFRHKTSKGFTVPLFPQLVPLLERLRSTRQEGEGSDAPVFKIKDAKRGLLAACQRLSLPSYSHRAFRRMFITLAVEKGIDPKVIAAWQGHQDGGRLILSTYSHLRPIHSESMAELMNGK